MTKLLCDKEVRQLLATVGLPNSRKTLQKWVKSKVVPDDCYAIVEPSGWRRWNPDKTFSWIKRMAGVA